jgi:uncharacterized membrane protein
MKPLLVLIASWVILCAFGRVRGGALREPIVALRWALAVMFLFTASAHFVSPLREELIRMVPRPLPSPAFLVTFTGVLEMLGALGLVLTRTARPAALGLALLLVALFPANYRAAMEGLELGGAPVTPLVPRALLQILLIAVTLFAGCTTRSDGNERTSP